MAEKVPESPGQAGQTATDELGPGGMRPPPTRMQSRNPYLSTRTIRGKLVISLFVIYMLGSLAAAAALFSISRLEGKIGVIEFFSDLNQQILETRRYEKNFLLYGNQNDLINALKYLEGVERSMWRLRSITSIPRISARLVLPPEEAKIEVYGDLLRRLARLDLPERERAAIEADIRRRGHALTQYLLDVDRFAREAVEEEAKSYRDTALTILASALASGAVLSILLGRWLIRPIESIRWAVGRIMRGELSEIPTAPIREQSEECAHLVDSLNMMLLALEEKQKQLIQSAKLAAIGKVTAGIAHEINNPLNNISLTAEALLEDLPDLESEERLEMIRDVLNEADRAREVVRHLLDFSRARESTARERVDLVDLLQRTMALLKNQIRIDRIDTRFDLPEEPVRIMGNANQLQQVLVNIILNAVQAMGPGGILCLRITSNPQKGKAVLEISDTGSGIPEDIKERIFDPFFTTKREGTGLGLSVSHAIVREHKGEITLDSHPEIGTTFRLSFPLAGPET